MYRSTSVGTRFLTTPRYVYRVSWCLYRCPSCILGSIPVNRRVTVASDRSFRSVPLPQCLQCLRLSNPCQQWVSVLVLAMPCSRVRCLQSRCPGVIRSRGLTLPSPLGRGCQSVGCQECRRVSGASGVLGVWRGCLGVWT